MSALPASRSENHATKIVLSRARRTLGSSSFVGLFVESNRSLVGANAAPGSSGLGDLERHAVGGLIRTRRMATVAFNGFASFRGRRLLRPTPRSRLRSCL